MKDFVTKHYLGDYPSAAKIYMGIFYNGVMVGTVIYGSPIAFTAYKAIFKNGVEVSNRDILELKRLFLVDDEAILPKDSKKNLAGIQYPSVMIMWEQNFQK